MLQAYESIRSLFCIISQTSTLILNYKLIYASLKIKAGLPQSLISALLIAAVHINGFCFLLVIFYSLFKLIAIFLSVILFMYLLLLFSLSCYHIKKTGAVKVVKYMK